MTVQQSASYPAPSALRSGIPARLAGLMLALLIAVAALFSSTLASLVHGLGRWVLWAFTGLFGFWAVKLFLWAFFPKTPRLTVWLFGDRMEFHRRGRLEDVVSRRDIELVVLNEGGVEGIHSLEVYGADEALLGVWNTGWISKPAPLVMRLLKRHGFPYALRRVDVPGAALYGDTLFYRRAADPSRHPAPGSSVMTQISTAGQADGHETRPVSSRRLAAGQWFARLVSAGGILVMLGGVVLAQVTHLVHRSHVGDVVEVMDDIGVPEGAGDVHTSTKLRYDEDAVRFLPAQEVDGTRNFIIGGRPREACASMAARVVAWAATADRELHSARAGYDQPGDLVKAAPAECTTWQTFTDNLTITVNVLGPPEELEVLFRNGEARVNLFVSKSLG